MARYRLVLWARMLIVGGAGISYANMTTIGYQWSVRPGEDATHHQARFSLDNRSSDGVEIVGFPRTIGDTHFSWDAAIAQGCDDVGFALISPDAGHGTQPNNLLEYQFDDFDYTEDVQLCRQVQR